MFENSFCFDKEDTCSKMFQYRCLTGLAIHLSDGGVGDLLKSSKSFWAMEYQSCWQGLTKKYTAWFSCKDTCTLSHGAVILKFFPQMYNQWVTKNSNLRITN